MFMFTYFAFYYSRFLPNWVTSIHLAAHRVGINQVLVASGKSRCSLPETSINIKQYKTVDQPSSRILQVLWLFENTFP